MLLAGPAYNKMLQIVKADILTCILKLIRHNNEWVFFLKDTAMEEGRKTVSGHTATLFLLYMHVALSCTSQGRKLGWT